MDTRILQACSEIDAGASNGLSDWRRRPVRPATSGRPGKRFSRPVSAFAGRWDGGGSRTNASRLKAEKALVYPKRQQIRDSQSETSKFLSSPINQKFKRAHTPPWSCAYCVRRTRTARMSHPTIIPNSTRSCSNPCEKQKSWIFKMSVPQLVLLDRNLQTNRFRKSHPKTWSRRSARETKAS